MVSEAAVGAGGVEPFHRIRQVVDGTGEVRADGAGEVDLPQVDDVRQRHRVDVLRRGVAGPAGRADPHIERRADDLDLVDPVGAGGDRVNEVVPGPVHAGGVRGGEAGETRARRGRVERDVEIAAVKAETVDRVSGGRGDVERIAEPPGDGVVVVSRDHARRPCGVQMRRVAGREGELRDPGRGDGGAHLAERVPRASEAGRRGRRWDRSAHGQ